MSDSSIDPTAEGHPIPGGFTGTMFAFLEWLQERLVYGGVVIGDPKPAEVDGKRLVRRVHLMSAGHSGDEDLLDRVERGSLFAQMFWTTSHRGGVSVYEIPVQHFGSAEELTWLDPSAKVLRRLDQARELIVHTADGAKVSVPLPHGAQLSFSEPDSALVIEVIDPGQG